MKINVGIYTDRISTIVQINALHKLLYQYLPAIDGLNYYRYR
jgi:hypothetical protein